MEKLNEQQRCEKGGRKGGEESEEMKKRAA
jgi:hypothetical protein